MLLKSRQQGSVEPPGGSQIRAEWLFDDDARASCASRFSELLHDRCEQGRRNGQVVRRPLGGAEFFAKLLKSRRVCRVAVHTPQQAGQSLKRCGVNAAVMFQTVARPRPKLV